ncbi:hypothetical protein Taro_044060 [Colocasia esculenta]|uniref:Uncharacterized protein n=1 Tax=Colocasia esculenta TaxID=4460 RepID=A0A843X1Y8_COLES|nr:hypothetical protein [Colocasia esculenta]
MVKICPCVTARLAAEPTPRILISEGSEERHDGARETRWRKYNGMAYGATCDALSGDATIGGSDKAMTRPYDRAASDHRVVWRPDRRHKISGNFSTRMSFLTLAPQLGRYPVSSDEADLATEALVKVPRRGYSPIQTSYSHLPKLRQGRPGARHTHVPHNGLHVVNRQISVSPPSPLDGLCRSGRELGSSVTRRPSAPQKGFIDLVVSDQSGEKRLNGHLGRSRPIVNAHFRPLINAHLFRPFNAPFEAPTFRSPPSVESYTPRTTPEVERYHTAPKHDHAPSPMVTGSTPHYGFKRAGALGRHPRQERPQRTSCGSGEITVVYKYVLGMGKAQKKEKQAAAPKGYVPMLVGSEERAERLLVPAELLNHPAIMGLLEMAAQEFGYQRGGVLRVPCDVDLELFKVVHGQTEQGKLCPTMEGDFAGNFSSQMVDLARFPCEEDVRSVETPAMWCFLCSSHWARKVTNLEKLFVPSLLLLDLHVQMLLLLILQVPVGV